jgi:hypothetical protein
MTTYNMTRASWIIMVAILATAVACPVSGASGRSGTVAGPHWPEQTVYQPECRLSQGDGTWLPSRSVECDW